MATKFDLRLLNQSLNFMNLRCQGILKSSNIV